MTTPSQQGRRATIEDLPKLQALWQTENFPITDLEKRFKEFQLVEGPSGEIAGAIGLQIAASQGVIHSEAFAYPQHAEELRAQLWERIKMVAKNHGLVRVWVQSASPFWASQGFVPPAPDTPHPAGLTDGPVPVSCLQLRESSGELNVDKEFALFKEAERESTERVFRQARVIKFIAALIALGVFIVVVVFAFSWFKLQGKPGAREPRIDRSTP